MKIEVIEQKRELKNVEIQFVSGGVYYHPGNNNHYLLSEDGQAFGSFLLTVLDSKFSYHYSSREEVTQVITNNDMTLVPSENVKLVITKEVD